MREQGWGHPEERARVKSTGDQGRIHTGPPDIGKDLREAYDGKSKIKEKRHLPSSQS